MSERLKRIHIAVFVSAISPLSSVALYISCHMAANDGRKTVDKAEIAGILSILHPLPSLGILGYNVFR